MEFHIPLTLLRAYGVQGKGVWDENGFAIFIPDPLTPR